MAAEIISELQQQVAQLRDGQNLMAEKNRLMTGALNDLVATCNKLNSTRVRLEAENRSLRLQLAACAIPSGTELQTCPHEYSPLAPFNPYGSDSDDDDEDSE